MGILDRLSLLLLLCFLIHFLIINLENVRGFLLMDIAWLDQFNMESNFGCGFLLSGSFGQLFKGLGLLVLFAIGLQFLRNNGYFFGFISFLYDFRRKSGVLSKGFCSKIDLDVKSSSKIAPLMYKLLDETKENENKSKTNGDAELYEDNNDCDFGGKELCDEDMEFDVVRLRKLIKSERGRARKACLDLEKERLASATASEEAMSMILRLQTEKSLIELEAKQYRRLAEEKQLHNQEVIKSLQQLLLKHETERGLLGNQFSSCRQKLKVSPFQLDDGDYFENSINPGISSTFYVDSSS